jgi:hypothetical protein
VLQEKEKKKMANEKRKSSKRESGERKVDVSEPSTYGN